MVDPNIHPSDEVRREAVTDFIIAEDWETRFVANAAGMRALRTELDEATDPTAVLQLTEMRGETLLRGLGSGVLSVFKRDTVAERAEFEVEFGETQ